MSDQPKENPAKPEKERDKDDQQNYSSASFIRAEVHFADSEIDQRDADQQKNYRLEQRKYRLDKWKYRHVERPGLRWEKWGVIAVLAYTTVAVFQWCASYNSNELIRRNFEISEHPYVSFGRKDGIVAEFVEPKAFDGPNALVGLNIYLRNGGRGPALTPNVGIVIGATLLIGGATPSSHATQPSPEKMKWMLRWKSKTDGSVHDTITSDPIVPDSDYVHFAPNQFTQEQAAALREGKRFTLIIAALEYCDEFGNYTTRTVELYWQGSPFNRFAAIDGPSLHYFPYPKRREPDQEYLQPCEQPDEREAREKADRERIQKLIRDVPIASPSLSAVASPTR